MGKLTDRQIRHWIKADKRFEHHGDVKAAHIDAMLQTIVKRGAPSIANDVLRWVRRMFDFAVKRHMMQYNPASQGTAGGTR